MPQFNRHLYCCSLVCLAGAQQLQLVMECTEVQVMLGDDSRVNWGPLFVALQSCPYPALVEFNTRHGRTLLTLAERSMKAALAAADEPCDVGSTECSASSSSSSAPAAEADNPQMAEQLGICLSACLDGGARGRMFAGSDRSYEATGEPCQGFTSPGGLLAAAAAACVGFCP
jgi:hypothetical protein